MPQVLKLLNCHWKEEVLVYVPMTVKTKKKKREIRDYLPACWPWTKLKLYSVFFFFLVLKKNPLNSFHHVAFFFSFYHLSECRHIKSRCINKFVCILDVIDWHCQCLIGLINMYCCFWVVWEWHNSILPQDFFQMRKYESHCQTLDYEICMNMTQNFAVLKSFRSIGNIHVFIHLCSSTKYPTIFKWSFHKAFKKIIIWNISDWPLYNDDISHLQLMSVCFRHHYMAMFSNSIMKRN